MIGRDLSDPMQQTSALLMNAFGKDISGLILGYTMSPPDARGWYSVALAGEWETCQADDAQLIQCLYGAYQGNHIHIVESVIERDMMNDWDYLLYWSCVNDWSSMVELAVLRGANNWPYALRGACQGGSRQMVDLTIFHGANNWDDGLYSACESCHYDIAEMMIARGARVCGFCDGRCHI